MEKEILDDCRKIRSYNLGQLGQLLKRIEEIARSSTPQSVHENFEELIQQIKTLILADIEKVENIELVYASVENICEHLQNYFKTGALPSEPILSEVSVSKAQEDLPMQDAEDDIFSDFLSEAVEYTDNLENDLLLLEQHPFNKEIINRVFRPVHTLKGVSGFMGLKKLNKVTHETENLLDLARNGKIQVTTKVIEATLTALDLMKRIISHLSVNNRTEMLEDEKLEKFTAFMGSVLQMQQEEKPAAEFEPPVFESGGAEAVIPAQESYIKVKTGRLDYLIDAVGELVIASNLIREDKNISTLTDHDFSIKLNQLNRVVNDLQMSAMSLRMIPIGATFQKMNRVVRDLSLRSGKKIQLVLQGEDTDVDRHLVDSLYDPLVHMIRNSCDHGLENAEERLQKNKPESGTIALNAFHKGNSIVVEIIDDGQGLNKNRIVEKALQKGVVTEAELAEMNENEIYNLIFNPGFSTAQQITSISGRGVGMDVVLQTVKNLGGSIQIESSWEKGTKFSITIPLTLSIIEGLLVEIAGELFVIPIINVKRFIQPDFATINFLAQDGQTLKVGDQLLPIINFEEHFRLNGTPPALADSVLVIIENNTATFALKVDRIVGIQDIVVKNIGKKFEHLKVISGATILGNGGVGLIIDVNRIYN